jgi:hypothetical protein
MPSCHTANQPYPSVGCVPTQERATSHERRISSLSESGVEVVVESEVKVVVDSFRHRNLVFLFPKTSKGKAEC